MTKSNRSLAAISAILIGMPVAYPRPAAADPAPGGALTVAARLRPGQKQHGGDPVKAALNLVTAAQAELRQGSWETAYQKLLLADDEITHMHPKAAGVTGTPKGRPDVAHMQAMRADLRTALVAIENEQDAKAQKRLESLRKAITTMQR